jgi:hypothetical protein
MLQKFWMLHLAVPKVIIVLPKVNTHNIFRVLSTLSFKSKCHSLPNQIRSAREYYTCDVVTEFIFKVITQR